MFPNGIELAENDNNKIIELSNNKLTKADAILVLIAVRSSDAIHNFAEFRFDIHRSAIEKQVGNILTEEESKKIILYVLFISSNLSEKGMKWDEFIERIERGDKIIRNQ